MQLWQLLSQMHEDIDSQLPPSTWLAALLPPLVMHRPDLIAASTPSLGGFERSDMLQDTPSQPRMVSPETASIGSPCTGAGFSAHEGTPKMFEPRQAQCSFPVEFYPIGLDRTSADAVAKLVLEVCCCNLPCSLCLTGCKAFRWKNRGVSCVLQFCYAYRLKRL